jgi:predicted glycogen debranching enzyme
MTVSAPGLVLDWKSGDDPAWLREREWLVTNGLGGFASGTLLGIPTRRYHGLFVPNLTQPKGRYIMISRFDEEVISGPKRVALGGAELVNGSLQSEAHLHLQAFSFWHQMPTWSFQIDDHLVEKTIVMPKHQNMVLVQYRLLQGDPVQLNLRLYASFRRQDDALNHDRRWPIIASVAARHHEIQLIDNPLRLRFGVLPQDALFVPEEQESTGVLYRVERSRGYDHSEDLFSPGYFQVELRSDTPVTFAATTQDWDSLRIDGPTAIDAERKRVERLISIAREPARTGFPAQLVQAADQFIVLPGSRLEEAVLAEASGDELRTVIAGYHWFGDWGRDTMISLEGLTLCTGRFREAGAILRTFSHYVKDGLLPNLFPEGARQPLYHTVDATLWYFHAIDRYHRTVGDQEILHELYPVLQSIIEHHFAGTDYGIAMDAHDGLIRAGAPGYQLTWMDAKVNDWVVTPRRGKPVEIQALWYNALNLMAQWGEALGKPVEEYRRWAVRARTSFNARYWHDAGGYLFDLIDGENGDDASCRPNQVFALSLPHPILDEVHWRPMLACVEAQLLTPYGLRTLSPGSPDYKRIYDGDLRTRDAAYHQGTVWPWLIGHFIDAWLRVHGDRERARAMLSAFPSHLREAGIGSISEIFDAEAPYAPRGCIAQAWSVAEVLRAWLATEGAGKEGRRE